jgi:hypothetical protein
METEMATPAQIAANRRNAQRSTGPRTPEGKARAARNAITHGVRAQTLPPEFDAFHQALIADQNPANEAESALVREIAITLWQLNSLSRAEEAAYRENPSPAGYLKAAYEITRLRAAPTRILMKTISTLWSRP